MSSGGHIRQRSPGSFELRYMIGGRIATETVRTTSKRQAQARLRELVTAADRGAKAPASRESCAAWFDRWLASLDDEDLSPMTVLLYRRKVEANLRPMFGSIRLRDLDRATIRAKLAELQLARSTKSTLRKVLSASLSQAVEDGLIRHNPAAGWRRDKSRAASQERPEQAILTPPEIASLIEQEQGSMLFAPIVLGLGLGARRAEIAALTWARINLLTGDVTIRDALKEVAAHDVRSGPTKTGQTRVIRLPTSYLELLRQWKRRQAEQFLFLGVRPSASTPVCTRPDGTRLSPNQITDLFTTAAKRLGRVDVHFHSLRHSHASILLAAGEPIAAVQKRLGHGQASTTLDVYAHAIPRDDAAEADRLDKLLRGGKL